ncbi:hypothetical protein M2168_001449 [Streptomyces sp. CZ24]|nr:hypothetical protein [Streptomyces sp. CZ24]
MERNSRAKRLGGDRADVADGEAGEDAGEGTLLGRLDVVEHGEGVLLRLALLVGEEGDDLLLAGLRVALGQAAVRVEDVGADGQELVDGEVEEVALVAQRGLGGFQRLGEGGGGDVAEVLDVEALAAREVVDPLAQLGRAGAGVGAAEVDVALLHRLQRGAAFRALGRHGEGALGAVAEVGDGAEDLRDDVAGLAQDDGVADEDALGADHVLVVQGGELDLGAGHGDRLDLGVRGDAAGAADADADVDEAAVDLLGRVLPGDGPAGRAGGGAEAALEGDLVELDDDAVDLVLDGVPVVAVVPDELADAVESFDHLVVAGGGQAPGAQQVVGVREAVDGEALAGRRCRGRPCAAGGWR